MSEAMDRKALMELVDSLRLEAAAVVEKCPPRADDLSQHIEARRDLPIALGTFARLLESATDVPSANEIQVLYEMFGMGTDAAYELIDPAWRNFWPDGE